jgi:poly(hydroxyalkanoate) granule-associated protein
VVTKHADSIPQQVKDTAEQIWLAGVGALTLARTEGSKMFDTLVDVGKQVEKILPSPVAAAQAAKHTATEWIGGVQGLVDAQVKAALKRAGIPTRSEIEKLTARVEQLTASIESLKARK